MINVKIDDSGLNARLSTLAEKLKNTKPMMDLIGDYVVGSVRKNIEEGGRPNKYRPNIWGTTPLLKTAESYFKVQKNDVSDSSVTVSNAGGNAGFGHNAHLQVVTPNMRKYFLYQYSETHLVQWLKMALSKELMKPKRRYMMFQEPEDINAIKKIVEDYIAVKQ